MISSTDSGCIQTSFDKLTGLFDRVWLKMNVQKTVRVVCHPLREFGLWEDKTYTWRMTGVRRDYKERQRERFSCPKCGENLARGSLATHCQTEHNVAKGVPAQEG